MRPNISVCIAIYNGLPFISAQIESILSQLEPCDEIVAVDDGSTDSSACIVLGFNDSRIRYLRNRRNLGVVRTFERAISEARGDIIFLSDQDDIWEPHKICRTLEVFEQTRALCVLSDALMVDGNNASMGGTFFDWRSPGPGLFRNWMKNGFIGCALAFRTELRKIALPFPNTIYMHDQWIGLMATASGRVEFLHEPLIRYRRHSSNQTGMSPGSVPVMIQRRLALAIALGTRLSTLLVRRLKTGRGFL